LHCRFKNRAGCNLFREEFVEFLWSLGVMKQGV